MKTLKFCEILTTTDSKTHQIALKRWKNDVSPSKIRFERDLKHKNHEKSQKTQEICPKISGHSVHLYLGKITFIGPAEHPVQEESVFSAKTLLNNFFWRALHNMKL